LTVRFDLERNETWRYERREIAAAMAAYTCQPYAALLYETHPTLPCTTACSPYTITLPGADTMKGGIMGDDFFLSSVGATF
jgi:hypothetical protein